MLRMPKPWLIESALVVRQSLCCGGKAVLVILQKREVASCTKVRVMVLSARAAGQISTRHRSISRKRRMVSLLPNLGGSPGWDDPAY